VTLRGAAALGSLTLGLAACRAAPPHRNSQNPLRVRVATGDEPLAVLDGLRTIPSGAERTVHREPNALCFSFPRGSELELSGPGVCSIRLSSAEAGAAVLTPRITLSGPAADVGYESRFEITLRSHCAGDSLGSVNWEVTDTPLSRAETTEGGFRFVGWTRKAPSKLAAARPGSVIAISAAERAQTRITAHFTAPDGSVSSAFVDVTAAPRASGLPTVPLGERVLLAGKGYRVLKRPLGSVADPMPWGNVTSLVPDRSGTWLVESEPKRETRLLVSRYDEVPLDCGRAACHVSEARAAETSSMATAYQRFLDQPIAAEALECSQGCHTTGQPGRTDGGFSHALTALGLHASDLPNWKELPRSLRRSGGVTCLACHGPGHLPERDARWTILRNEVCAYCHDAPPRYGHVQALASSTLAFSDREVSTRTTAGCARCHTTWGFLDALSERHDGRWMPPDDAAPGGIACPACHAVHDERAVSDGLLRRVPLADIYADLPASALERSSACIYCHTPESPRGPSAAAIWAGRGAFDPVTAKPLLGPAPHAAVPGGCLGCHRAGPNGLERGRGHAFRADATACSVCHADQPNIPVLERAERLLTSIGGGARSRAPAHADERAADDVHERARSLIRFVLEDRGAAVHNPRYAQALLDRAEQILALPAAP
jgi:hypothetical protein